MFVFPKFVVYFGMGMAYFVTANVATSQDDVVGLSRQMFDGFEVSFYSITISVDYRGGVSAGVMEGPPSQSFGSLAFLENEQMIDELDIVGAQKVDLQTAIEAWQKTRREIEKKSTFNIQDYLECQINGWKGVDKVLVNPQRKAVAQFQLRVLMRNIGLSQFLSSQAICRFLELEQAELIAANRKMDELRNSFQKKLVEENRAIVERIFQGLSTEKRDLILQDWTFLAKVDSDFDRLRFQIEIANSKELDEVFKSSYLEAISVFPHFRVDLAGHFVPELSSKAEFSKGKIVLGMLKFEEFAEFLRLSDEQKDALILAKSERDRRVDQMVRRLDSQSAPIEELKALDSTTISDLNEIADDLVNKLLSKSQNDLLEDFAKGIFFRKRGFAYCLISNAGREKFGLTDSDQDLLKRNLEKALKMAEERSRIIEEEYIEEALSTFVEQKRIRFLDLIGPCPQNCPVVIGRLIAE